MRLRTIKMLACATLAMQAGAASAFFDVQVMAGKRWYEISGDDFGDQETHVSSQEMVLAAHIDPIPAVPVAFGVSAAMATMDKEAWGPTTKTATGVEIGLDIMAWIPMVPIVTPFARLRYPLMSTMAIEGESTVASETVKSVMTLDVSGPQIGLGVKWSPLPVLKVLLEVQKGMQTIKIDEVKLGDEKTSGDGSGDLASNAFLLGIEIGL